MRLIGKLKGRSADELYVRCAQLATTFRERMVLALCGAGETRRWMPPLDCGEALLNALHDCASSAPIPTLREPTAGIALLTDSMRADVQRNADAILQSRFRLFGGTEFHFGDPPNWHLEPRAEIVAPLRHWSKIAYLDPSVAGDKKIIWELNRQQHLMTLGRAFSCTADERYAEATVTFMQAWLAANPCKIGINWASALEVAYRTISWLWALFLIRTSIHLTPTAVLPVLAVIRASGRHVETYLSSYFSPNTHLTGEALCLFYLGILLPFLPEAQRWRSTGRRILMQELERQVRSDGTYFESATYYHRYTLDIYLNAAVLAQGIGDPFDVGSLNIIERLADALMAQIKPDGTHGYFGDDDGGRLLPLGEEALNDFRPALSNAAALFQRADFKACAGSLAEETMWLFGQEGVDRFERIVDRPKPAASRAFLDGGIFVLRDGGSVAANQMLIDCGPHGALSCGHAHADALAFELVANGRSLLMDAGTYTYTGSETARRAFRSTAFHNALTVDGKSSSEPAGPFGWATIARCKLDEWWSGNRFDVFAGRHDGFNRLADPVDCRRSVLFVKGNYWILRDRAGGLALHDYAQHFHFASDASPSIVERGIAYCHEQPVAGPGLDIVAFADGALWSLEKGWVSTRYTDRRPTTVAVLTVAASKAVDIVTFLLPRRPTDFDTVPYMIDVRDGRAYGFESGGGNSDLFTVRDGREVAADGVTSDADWLWLRRRDGAPEALVLRDATTVTLCGVPLLRAPNRVGLALWHEAQDLHIDFQYGEGEVYLSHFCCTHIVVDDCRFPAEQVHGLRFQRSQPKIECLRKM